jgi:DNA modification methylase
VAQEVDVKPWLFQRFAELVEQRPPGAEQDVHFPQSLAAAVIDEYTLPGQRVLDPFAGYGTTLVVAEHMDARQPVWNCCHGAPT